LIFLWIISPITFIPSACLWIIVLTALAYMSCAKVITKLCKFRNTYGPDDKDDSEFGNA
jgi:uncharacterized membrane protein YhaH (DUF805 family)